MEYYSAIKSKDIMSFAGKWMELESIFTSELTQIEKDMHGMFLLIRSISQKVPNTHDITHRLEVKQEGRSK